MTQSIGYGVIVRTDSGYDSFCTFDGSDDYEIDTSRAKAEQLLDECKANHPAYTYTLVQITVLE